MGKKTSAFPKKTTGFPGRVEEIASSASLGAWDITQLGQGPGINQKQQGQLATPVSVAAIAGEYRLNSEKKTGSLQCSCATSYHERVGNPSYNNGRLVTSWKLVAHRLPQPITATPPARLHRGCYTMELLHKLWDSSAPQWDVKHRDM